MNSADRRLGAEAVIRQFVEAGALGLITTYDLALTEIADRLDGQAEASISAGGVRLTVQILS